MTQHYILCYTQDRNRERLPRWEASERARLYTGCMVRGISH
jgi:hypothetical protein